MFGAVLGPMPDDALAEMVRTGALIPSDLVRHGPDDEWHPASDIPGLFPESTSPQMESGPTAEEIEEMTPQISSDGSFILKPPKPPSPVPIAPVQEPAPPSVPLPLMASLPQRAEENDLIANWKAQRGQTREQLTLNSLAHEIEEARDASVLEPIPDLFADDSSPDIGELSVEPPRRSKVERPSFLSLIEPETRGQLGETFAQKCRRWQRSLPTWPIGAAVVLLLIAAWWYWPRSQRGIYDRLTGVWTELKTRRTDFKDKAGWEEFLTQAQSEVDADTQWLEKHASAKDREKQLLLYVARDCLKPMLRKPRELGLDQEKQLVMLLQALEQHYVPGTAQSRSAVSDKKGPPKKTDKQGSSKNADPEKAESGGILDPAELRRAPDASTSKPPSK